MYDSHHACIFSILWVQKNCLWGGHIFYSVWGGNMCGLWGVCVQKCWCSPPLSIIIIHNNNIYVSDIRPAFVISITLYWTRIAYLFLLNLIDWLSQASIYLSSISTYCCFRSPINSYTNPLTDKTLCRTHVYMDDIKG